MNGTDAFPGAGRRLRFGPLVGLAAATALLMATVFAGTAAASHVNCGDVITESTTLDGDVGPCSADGLVVRGDGITLDLGGHRVFAANGEGDNAGIRLARVTGATLTNGTVELFDAGVMIGGGSGNTVRDLTAQDNVNDFMSRPCELGDGIAVFDSSDNTIVDNEALRNGPFSGISVVGDSDGNVIRSNVASDNDVVGRFCGNARQDEGIRIEGPGANDNRVENNRAERNLLAGIGLHGYVCTDERGDVVEDPNTGTIITGNVVRDTAGTTIASGINFLQQGPADVVCPSFANTVDKNVSSGNQADGIFVAANSHDNVINRNVVNDNGASGVFLNDPRFSNEFTNVGPTLLDLVSPDRAPYEQGVDYRVMPGSGSGDVTGTLKAIDITLAPGADPTNNPQPRDTSTSGCEQADYDAAGFQTGDVALIQRGTCTFVSKVDLAIANGASAVIMFNEGQAPNRTTFEFGSVGPVSIPVIAASYSVGFELFQLTQAGPVTIRVTTNTTNVRTLAAPAPYDNTLFGNRGFGNAEFDGYDGNTDPPCDDNKWRASRFGTVNQPCVVGPGGSGEARGRTGGPGRSEDAGQDVGRDAPTGTQRLERLSLAAPGPVSRRGRGVRGSGARPPDEAYPTGYCHVLPCPRSRAGPHVSACRKGRTMLGMDVFLDGSRRLRFAAALGLAAATALLLSLLFAGTAAATHVECGETITSDTTLDSDLAACQGNGIVIGADKVTLDLNGHSVSGDPEARAALHEEGAGILFSPGVSGSTVLDGTVEQFDAGVVIRGGSGNAVRDLLVRDNINYRVLTGVDAAPAEGNSCDYGDGIALFNADNNRIENNEVIHNGPLSGISLVEDSDANLVSRNVVADNDVLNVTPGDDRTVCGTGADQGPMSTGREVQDIGIRIEGPGADDNRVQRNEVTGNALVGIAIHGYVCNPPMEGMPPAPNNGGNLVFKNNVSGTGQDTNQLDDVADGIATLSQGPASIVCVAHSNTIKNNVSSGNLRDGIFMGGRGSHDNTVINNRVNDNARDGLHVSGPSFDRDSGEQVTPGAIDNKLLANKGTGNGNGFNMEGDEPVPYNGHDGFDGNLDPPCDNNMWRGSKFDTVNQSCVWGPGGAKGSGGAKKGSGKATGSGRR